MKLSPCSSQFWSWRTIVEHPELATWKKVLLICTVLFPILATFADLYRCCGRAEPQSVTFEREARHHPSAEQLSASSQQRLEVPDPHPLISQWRQQLQPSSPLLSQARARAMELFAQIVICRQQTMEHGNDPSQWRGFYYEPEVSPSYLDGRIPPRLRSLYATRFVDLTHVRKFDFRFRTQTFKTANELVTRVLQDTPIITDCGGIASLLQMYAYASISETLSMDRVNACFLGFPPSGMSYMVDQAYEGISGPPNIGWHLCETQKQCDDLQPLDMCYVHNDPRYVEFTRPLQPTITPTQPSAFHGKFQGHGRGWWLTYVGKNVQEEDLYIGFGGDDGPKTLQKWVEALRQEFLEKWGVLPEDWTHKVSYYPSPIREVLAHQE